MANTEKPNATTEPKPDKPTTPADEAKNPAADKPAKAKKDDPTKASVFTIAIGQMKVGGKVRKLGAKVKHDELRPDEIEYFVKDGTLVPA